MYTGAADIYCNASKVNGWGPWRFSLDGESLTEYFLESWSVSDDGKTWTVTLRDGIMWSDGTPVTTEDARYAIEDWYTHDLTMGAGKIKPPRWLRGPSDSPAELQIVDDSTFRLVYDKAYYYLPRQSSGGCPGGTWEMIAPAHFMKQFHVEHNADADKVATEAGFEDWVAYYEQDRARLSRNPDRPTITPWVYMSLPGDQVYRLERNPYYFSVDPAGNQLPYIDTVAMELVSDREVLNLKLMQGEIDFQHRHVRFGNFPVLKDNEQKSDYRVVEGPTATYGDYVAINPDLRRTRRRPCPAAELRLPAGGGDGHQPGADQRGDHPRRGETPAATSCRRKAMPTTRATSTRRCPTATTRPRPTGSWTPSFPTRTPRASACVPTARPSPC